MTEKKTKSRWQNEPENPPRKEQERENGVSEEKERRKSKKKSNGCTSNFYIDFCLAVTLFKNPALVYIFLTLVPDRNPISKGYILKSNY